MLPRSWKIATCKKCKDAILKFDGIAVTTSTIRMENGQRVATEHTHAPK